MNFQLASDTIAALATPPGQGALGIIRISGPEALSAADGLFQGRTRLAAAKGYSVHFGTLVSGAPPQAIDEVLATVFRAPLSFTGEDVVEFSAHGSPYILTQILHALREKGIRMALPGEFTQRAFLNGKLDLAQAEAVGDLIASETEAQHRTALTQVRGGFSQELNTLREELIRLTALLELELDFAEEDVAFADRQQLEELIRQLLSKAQTLIDSFRLGNVIKEGVQVAIIGRPNAGKSTLLNALLQEDRALVSDIAGTTRDTIEETLNIGGVLFRLTDTAGIRTHSTDLIENMGMERSRENARKADIVIVLTDASAPDRDDVLEGMEAYADKTLTVWNKADKLSGNETPPAHILLLSAREGQGLEELREKLYEKAVGHLSTGSATVVTNARHQEALLHTKTHLEAVQQGMAQGLSGDLLSIDIRQALYWLGSITGRVEIDRDVLGAIFSQFCIGK